MSARGELYADEVCRDVFQKELNKAFGKHTWRLNGSKFSDLWDEREFPDVMEIDIHDNETDDKIGVLVVKNRFYIEDDGYGKYIQVEPEKIIEIQKADVFGRSKTPKR